MSDSIEPVIFYSKKYVRRYGRTTCTLLLPERWRLPRYRTGTGRVWRRVFVYNTCYTVAARARVTMTTITIPSGTEVSFPPEPARERRKRIVLSVAFVERNWSGSHWRAARASSSPDRPVEQPTASFATTVPSSKRDRGWTSVTAAASAATATTTAVATTTTAVITISAITRRS